MPPKSVKLQSRKKHTHTRKGGCQSRKGKVQSRKGETRRRVKTGYRILGTRELLEKILFVNLRVAAGFRGSHRVRSTTTNNKYQRRVQ